MILINPSASTKAKARYVGEAILCFLMYKLTRILKYGLFKSTRSIMAVTWTFILHFIFMRCCSFALGTSTHPLLCPISHSDHPPSFFPLKLPHNIY